jgi:superfamily I DNA/RNA helicase
MQAEDPDRRGEKPEVRLLGTRAESIETIAKLAKRNRGKELGVVIPNNKKMVRHYHKELSKKLSSAGFTVQAYNHASKVLTADSLTFDQGNTITIVNMASVKGLEFDVVFAAEMQSFDVADDRLEAACKNLYVVCSRARENLYLCFTLDEEDADFDGIAPPSLGLLPPEKAGLCRYLPKERWSKLSRRIEVLAVPRHVD